MLAVGRGVVAGVIALCLLLGSQRDSYAGAGDSRVDAGEAEVGLRWVQTGNNQSGAEFSIAYGLASHVQLELGVARMRDRAEQPDARATELDWEVEWWPRALSGSVSAGLKLGIGRARITRAGEPAEYERSQSAALMLALEYRRYKAETELRHGREREEQQWVGRSGVALTVGIDLTDSLALGLELGKDQQEPRYLEFALDVELTRGLDLVVLVGKKSPDTYGSIGLEFSF